MKSLTVKLLTIVFALCCSIQARAQFVQTNPLEWLALAEGNEAINGQIQDQVEGQTKTAVLQNTIAAEFNRIHEWERKYSDYLQTVEGYASSLKAATTLYEDGVRIFITLGKLRKAVTHNPQGIVATMSMNNLYIETATELVSVYTLLRNGWPAKHADGCGTKRNPLGVVRPAGRFQQEASTAPFEHPLLHDDRCVEQCHGRHD